ncbi:phage tail tape measure protein [Lactobacillus crispatus]|jgi:phage tail tape measure protein, TP901 family|uniref:phage tail tape measure protein n=1 Tax=Lactobacillus crispatus TaxID=47770 RepID=UPI000280C8E9|nr:phage tail tape measure protein [Lactobacillus crispatus]EKB68063.1 phage tail tape measure protein, TP901 family, core region [Lactobacillus crispatus FB049-03]MBI1701761.1 phage tail tape measure protein [Lactobacillus crispatus]MBI1716988.1 phage tail tape measure protein [Lactobacillus crispatus]MCZ3591233.1 phage tail tape measure protein [Lactobacillus crispatus]MCZ3599796.1 phage tail tape measure protein [Lactobacillus crispatus]
MADAHEGMSLSLKANFTQVNEAKKATQALNSAFGELQRRANSLHMSANFPREINHIDTVTASYVKRLESEGKTYEANQQKVNAYQGAIGKLSAEQSRLQTALNRTTSSTDKASDAYRSQQIKLNQTTAEINKFKAGIKSAQSEMKRIHPTGFNRWVKGANEVNKITDTVKGKLHSAFSSIKGGAIASAGAIGAVGAAAFSGAKQSAAIQQRYREINNLAVLGGEKQKEVTKSVTEMQRQGRDMSIKYGKSQQEIAAGYEDLIKRGYTTKQALGALQAELQASVASGDDFKDVTTVSSQVLEAFGMKADSTKTMLKNTKEVVNELAYSADATSTRFSDLGVAMSYVGEAAHTNSISLSETASALGVLSNHGMESDKAGTNLRGTINGLTNQINKIGKKNSIFTQLGITKSEMLDAHGNIKSLSHDMGVLYKHVQEHSKGGSQTNGFFRSIFGTTAMNGALTLAKYSSEVSKLDKNTQHYGKTGTYVAQLAKKNMATAQGNMASAKRSLDVFKMTLGNALLPALNQASNALAKFLLSKDGKKFQKDVGGAVGYVANKLVAFIKWTSTHEKEVEWIGKGLLVGYSAVKAAQFISFLGKVKDWLEAIKSIKFVGGLFGKGLEDKAATATVQRLGGAVTKGATRGNAGILTGALQSAKSAGGFKNLTTVGKIANVGAGIGVGIDAGTQVFSAIKNRHNAEKRSQDIGGAVGTGAGGLIGLAVGGPMGAAFGAQIGKVAGRWGGHAVNQFTKGWQKSKPPKSFWSLENLGWSTHDMFNEVGKGWNKGVKGVGKWIHDIPSNIGKTGTSIKNWAGNVGNNIHKGFDTATRNTHNFFKSLPKNTRKTGSNIKNWASKTGINIGKGINSGWKKAKTGVSNFGKWYGKKWNDIWKSVNNNRYVKAFKKGQLFQTAFKDMKSRWNAFSKWFGKGWNGFWAKIGKWAKNSWNGIKRNWNNFWGSLPQKWEAFKKGFAKGWSNFWGGIKKAWDNSIGGIIKAWNGFTGKLGAFGKWAKNSWTGTKNNVKGFTNRMIYGAGGKKTTFKYDKFAHANGGTMHTSHGALVGEAGPELAYKPYANDVRLLGANGPQFTKVHAGEHILNARDTAKVLNGGLGNGLTLKGYASGTDKLGKTSKKVTNDYKQIADKSSKSLNSLSKKSSSTWNKITRQTGKDSSKTRKRAISDYSDMHKGIVKQMDKTHDGVISLSESTAKGFGKALDKTKGYARDAMSDSIGEINKGITGIDKVLGQFGGNTSVIKPVKFASGTDANGRLTENTLAMVNDAQTGPRQEALVSDKNELFLPRGNNVTMMLPKGWGVLNGTQTQQVAKSAGVKHFAKGSGLSHSALRKLAEKAGANPAQSFKEMYLDKLKPSGSNLKRGSIGLVQNSSQHFGNPWSNAMWTVINNAIGGGDGKGGTREAFLRFAESTFSGVPYVMGAMSKAASDCSGMVAQALKHFGINAGRSTVDMQHSSALQYLGKSINRTIPGDLVIFGHGTGAAGHVGIVKNPRTGTMFNETPPKARVTRIADDMGMGYGFYRVKGLHNASTAKKTAKPATNLTALAKRELGPAALKWIKDKLGDEGSLGGNIGGEGVKRWAGTVKRVLGMLHLSTSDSMVARVLRQIQTESGGNPNARQPGSDPDGDGSGPALGLMQTKRATFEAFKRKGSGGIFNGPANIYAGLNYAKHRYGSSLSALGNGHGYAKGGRPKAHTPFIAGERGPELITADGPVKVDSHEQTKRKVSDLAQMFKFPKINRPTRSHSSAPVININLNGPIYGTREDAKRIAELVRREINKVLVNISDELGTDPSLY